MKGITAFAECAYYDMKSHKCTRGCTIDPDKTKCEDVRFYADCPLPDVEPVRHDETGKAMFDMGYDYGFDFAAKACKPDWIPCAERLPEEDKMVIVCCFGSDMIMPNPGESLEDAIKRTRKEIVTVTMGFIGSDGWYGADWCPMIVTPTYWMPLPEPPEVSENE